MRNLLFVLLVGFSLTSCTFHEPVFKGGEKINLEKVSGQTVKFTAGGIIENENWFGIKVKPSMLDLYVDGDYFGKVSLDKKVKIKRKSDSYVEANFTADLEDGAIMKAMRLATKKDMQVTLKGKAKAGVFIFSKKMEINKSKTIPGSIFGRGK